MGSMNNEHNGFDLELFEESEMRSKCFFFLRQKTDRPMSDYVR